MTNKNAHPAVGAAEQAIEKEILDQTSLSYNDFTTARPQKQGLVESLLLEGEENATPSSELVRLTGCKSVRELQNQIAHERETGALILSTCRGGGGYFLPAPGEAGQREIAAFVTTLRARALNTLKALKAAREALQSIDGQVTLDDLEEV